VKSYYISSVHLSKKSVVVDEAYVMYVCECYPSGIGLLDFGVGGV
jgi:hypothetical protein